MVQVKRIGAVALCMIRLGMNFHKNTVGTGGKQILINALMATLNPGDADVFFDQDDALPSIGLVLEPIDDVTLRASYSETIARQTFKELTPIIQPLSLDEAYLDAKAAGSVTSWAGWLYRLLRRMDTANCRAANLIVTLSEDMVTTLQERARPDARDLQDHGRADRAGGQQHVGLAAEKRGDLQNIDRFSRRRALTFIVNVGENRNTNRFADRL
mgnify:CR=1 FL=1